VDPPFGALAGSAFRVQPLPLDPGDRLVFVTDGVLERDAAGTPNLGNPTADRARAKTSPPHAGREPS
jgi:serine phosphatase RsbU (regulator of sigma subunit)